MSETKRVSLTTLVSKKPDEKKTKETKKTHRFVLTLLESNEETCSEFNYRDLLSSVEKRPKEKVSSDIPVNGFDPFDEEDDDVRRIAKQFEEKYGCGFVGKKKRKFKKDDYADIGAGYDESDSFIDNTDAYDEVVPADVTTLHGGFYINSGALEFKQVEISDHSDEESSPQKASKRRIIEDSSESSADEFESQKEKTESNDECNAISEQEKKQKIDKNGLPKKKIGDESFLKKKKILDKKKKVIAELVKKKCAEIDLSIQNTVEVEKASLIDVNTPKEVKETKIEKENVLVKSVDVSSNDENSLDSISSHTSNESTPYVSQPLPEKRQIEATPLPEDLPENILELISLIKKASETSEGKVKFFSGAVNSHLLNLEKLGRTIQKSKKLKIYDHLAAYVKCKRDTFIRRAKNLVLEDSKRNLEELLKTLKAYIDATMPQLLERYLEQKNSKDSVQNGEDGKQTRAPRKKFLWSSKSIKILQEIVSSSYRCYQIEKKRKLPFETYFENFLKNEVLKLWPSNWVSMNHLMSQCRPFFPTPVKKLNSTNPLISPNTSRNTDSPSSVSRTTATPPITTSLKAATPPAMSVAVTANIMRSISTNCSGLTVTPVSVKASEPPLPITSKLEVTPVSTKSIETSIPSKVELPAAAKYGELSISINPAKPPADKAIEKITNPVVTISPKSSLSITPMEPRMIELGSGPSAITPSTKTESPPLLIKQYSHSVLLDPPTSSTSGFTTAKPISLKKRILETSSSEKSSTSVKTSLSQIQKESVIDLTDEFPKKHKPRSTPPSRPKEDISANSLTQIIGDSLASIPKAKFAPPAAPSPSSVFYTESLLKSSVELPRISPVGKNVADAPPDNDDISQLMQNLKELEQMSHQSPTKSPVSVIAFNSQYSPAKQQHQLLHAAGGSGDKRNTSPHMPSSSANSGYQDLYRKNLFNETTASLYTNPASSKSNYSSNEYFPYQRNTPESIAYQQKYYQNMNSNAYYTNAKSMPPQQFGSNAINNDYQMYQNYLYEYGYPKPSGPKPQ